MKTSLFRAHGSIAGKAQNVKSGDLRALFPIHFGKVFGEKGRDGFFTSFLKSALSAFNAFKGAPGRCRVDRDSSTVENIFIQENTVTRLCAGNPVKKLWVFAGIMVFFNICLLDAREPEERAPPESVTAAESPSEADTLKTRPQLPDDVVARSRLALAALLTDSLERIELTPGQLRGFLPR